MREVTHIGLNVIEPGGILSNRVTGWLDNETRTTFVGIPVVIGEMVKTRLGHYASPPVTVLVICTINCDREVKRPSGRQALASRNNARSSAIIRNTHRPLVRMGGEKLDHSEWGGRIKQELMNRFEWRYLLKVTIAARVIVRPQN